MDISVVVPTYNQADLLRECLRSLVDQTVPKDAYEIVVVDDASTDRTSAVLAEFAQWVRVVRLPANRGRSAARNAGILGARAPLIVLVDSDILVHRDFLEQHLRTHRRRGSGILSRGPVISVSDAVGARNGAMPWVFASPAYLTTANAAVEKSALLRAGLFDEGFPGYGWEDFELGLRLKRLGIRRVFCRKAVAFHIDPHNYWDDVPALLQKEEARAKSAVYFYRKHPTPQARWLIQSTNLHRVIYWLQSGCGAFTPANVQSATAELRRTKWNLLAHIVLRGVLNSHYLQRLTRELRGDGQAS